MDVSSVAAADPGSTLPAGWQHGAFMEIFVRSYKDSDGDGIGDLRGLTAQLDYLRDLGITGLWLMPVTTQPGRRPRLCGGRLPQHRDRSTAAWPTWTSCCAQAHARGIGVIIDYVINHSAAQNPLFVNAQAGSGNAYRDWYLWQGLKPGGLEHLRQRPLARQAPATTTSRRSGTRCPTSTCGTRPVVAWHHDNLRFWLNRGVDGFRFDAVGNLVENGAGAWENQPQNYTLLRDARALMNSYAQRFLVCEGPSDPVGYTGGLRQRLRLQQHRTTSSRAAKGDAAAVQRVADFHKTAPAGIVRRCCPTTTLRRPARLRPVRRQPRAVQARRGDLPAAAGHAVHLLRRGDRHGRRQRCRATRSCARR